MHRSTGFKFVWTVTHKHCMAPLKSRENSTEFAEQQQKKERDKSWECRGGVSDTYGTLQLDSQPRWADTGQREKGGNVFWRHTCQSKISKCQCENSPLCNHFSLHSKGYRTTYGVYVLVHADMNACMPKLARTHARRQTHTCIQRQSK